MEYLISPSRVYFVQNFRPTHAIFDLSRFSQKFMFPNLLFRGEGGIHSEKFITI